MRLLNTNTLNLHEFFGVDIPKYVVLSHRWEEEEISIQDLLQMRNQQKGGWEKVKRFCDLARRYNYKYAWVDTCCIDKTSSAELSEAINSMFQWYRNADICCVYLNDVSRSFVKMDNRYVDHVDLASSKWFTRGWTLQELLAPNPVWFIGKDWKDVIGSKEALAKDISKITNIPEEFVRNFTGSTVSRPQQSSGMPSIAEVLAEMISELLGLV